MRPQRVRWERVRVRGTWVTMPAIMATRKAARSGAAKRSAKRSTKKSPRKLKRAAEKLPKDAVTLLVYTKAREGQELLLEAELRSLVAPTRKEEGCLVYDLHRAADAPGGYLLHEVWSSRDAHTAHTRTPHFLRWNARKDALVANRDSTFWKLVM
jgi:quinol monooxygenase YgiN